MQLSSDAEPALRTLLGRLKARDYQFVSITPASHARVLARNAGGEAKDLRDIFGWSLPFAANILPADMLRDLQHAGAVETLKTGLLRSRLRVSSLDDHLFLHSAYPTEAEDSVFFGPDSYRFVEFLRSELVGAPAGCRLADLGAGAGVGAILADTMLDQAALTLIDVNPLALKIAGINALHAGLQPEFRQGSGMDAASGEFDIVIANPPFIIDDQGRAYRDGGDLHGARISLDWALTSAQRLKAGGRVLLYTGVAIVDGRNPLCDQLAKELPALGCSFRCREIDADIFGEELSKPAYRDVERIAAVGIIVTRT